jgi:hypothetical protein
MRLAAALLLALASLSGCAAPDLQGLSKDERRFVLQQSAARRDAWRAVGLGFLNFGLQTAANSLNTDPNQNGFAK